MNVTWQHVVLVSMLLSAIVLTNCLAPDGVGAVTGVISTILTYLMRPQIGPESGK